MKKFLLAIVVIAAAVFTGCSKEEKSGSLAGTTWVYYEDGGFFEATISFRSNNNMDIVYVERDEFGRLREQWGEVGTYKYNQSKVSMTTHYYNDYYDKEEIYYYSGYINGNTMEFFEVYDSGFEDYMWTFRKK